MKGRTGLRSWCWLAVVATWTACRAPETFQGPPTPTGTGGAVGDDGGDSSIGGDSGGEEDSGTGGIIGSGGSIADAPLDLLAEAVADTPADVAVDQAGDTPRDLIPDAPPCVAAPGCFCEAYGGHAYSFCGTLRTYQAATSDCMTQSMRLVRVNDDAENQWAYGRKVARGFATTWIGANDLTTEGDWRWPDNTAFWSGKGAAMGGAAVGGLFSAWDTISDQPNQNGEEDCGAFRSPPDAAWADLPCAETHAYICEGY
jgi:hypothetical protein